MAQNNGFTYHEVAFDKQGRLAREGERARIADAIRAGNISDLVVLVHGWNSNADGARAQYTRIARSLRTLCEGVDAKLVKGRTVGLLGVLWPSKRFSEHGPPWAQRLASAVTAAEATWEAATLTR